MLHSANTGKESILFGDDSIVIQKYISGIPGGRTLDVTGYPLSVIPAGSLVIKKGKEYYPMPIVKDEAKSTATETVYKYNTLPTDAAYVGVLYRSIQTKDAQASIMFDGVVNEEVAPYDLATVKAAFKAAVPHIIFVKDEEAQKQ